MSIIGGIAALSSFLLECAEELREFAEKTCNKALTLQEATLHSSRED
jgi:hypothetical protein